MRPTQRIVNCTVTGSQSIANVEVASGVDATLRNTISVGGQGPAVVFKDACDPSAMSSCIVQTDGPEGTATIVSGASTATPRYYDAQAINGGVLLAESGQDGEVVAGVKPEELFTDAAGRNLQLKPTARARDFAVQTDAPAFDYLRRLRGVSGDGFDAGAYEYIEPVNAVHGGWDLYQ